MERRGTAFLAAGVVILGVAATNASAESVADFYDDKDITITVAFGAGGGYALYARTLSEFMRGHIPGKPNIVVQFMPGAGGAKAAEYLYKVAPRDGSSIGMLSNSAALAQVLQGDRLDYDASDFGYIGRMADMRSAIIVWHTAPVKTLEDAKTKTLIFGSTGKSSQDYMNPMLMKNVLGYRVETVMGYKGSNEINLAMEKGEVHAMANSWSSVKARLGHWLKDGKINVIAMVGLTPAPDLKQVPLLVDLAKNDEDRRILSLMASTTEIGRAFAVPPEVPEERIAALREAFVATMKDPEFLAAAKKRKVDLEYLSGEKLEKLVANTIGAPQTVIQRFKDAIEISGSGS